MGTSTRSRNRPSTAPGPAPIPAPASAHALGLIAGADAVDLHVESFIWTRVLRYDLSLHHRPGPLGGRLMGQVDLPRLRGAGFSGAVMSIATNPFRSARRRDEITLANLARLTEQLSTAPGTVVVENMAGYRAARSAGLLACFLALQGGNAVSPERVAALPTSVSRVTLVHLTPSVLGRPCSVSEELLPGRGLSAPGRAYVEALVERRILVDLAHAGARTFWDALEVHDGTGTSQPPIVSHTGARGVHDCWRNLDDSQIRAVADRGGVVGVMFHAPFLGGSSAAAVVRHLRHILNVGGEAAAALGSDWDGLILPPPELRSAEGLPLLVQAMLDAGFTDARVRRVLGTNALGAIAAARP